jgi:predicted amidohydrolase
MPCRNGDIDGNLVGAAAPREGAELVLLPELLAAGYIYTPAFWDAGETDTMGSHLNI